MITTNWIKVNMTIFAIVAFSLVYCNDLTSVPVEKATSEELFESYDAHLRFLDACNLIPGKHAGCVGCCGKEPAKPEGQECESMAWWPCFCGVGMRCINICEPCA
jgi:hypothetical protein